MKANIFFVLCGFLIIICLTLSHFACTKEHSNNNLESYKSLQKVEPVQLNFIGHWLDEGKKEQMLKELINEFEFVNQDVKINMVWAEKLYANRSKENVEGKFNAAVITSEKPEWDIIRINNAIYEIDKVLKEKYPDWVKKYLVDFSEIDEFRKNTRPELLTEEAKAEYGGICPGPYIDGYNWPLWCNTEVAKKVGIEVKQFEMTNDDFIGYLKAVFDYNKSHGDSIIALFEAGDWKTTATIAQMLFFSEIGNYEEIKDTRFSEKKLIAWDKVLHELERFSAYKPLPSNWEKIVWGNTMSYPINGKCLFYTNGTWMYNIWLKTDSSKLRNMMPTELPVFKPSPIYFGGYSSTWAVPKNAPHKDLAIKFLLFMNRPDVAEKWARYTKSPCGIKGNLTNVNFGLDRFEDFQYTIEKKYGQHKTSLNVFAYIFGKENENMINNSEKVFSGEIKADEAIQDIKKQLNKK